MTDLQQEAESIGERLDHISADLHEFTHQLHNQHLAWAAIVRFCQLSLEQRRQGVEAFKAEMASLGFDV